jgi:tRNA modification GTPase
MECEDEAIIALIEEYSPTKPFVCVLNKGDLPLHFPVEKVARYSPIFLSCKGDVNPLIEVLGRSMDHDNDSEEMMLISQRQIGAASEALCAIDEAYQPLQSGELELFSFHINQAIRAIGAITRPYQLDEMFDKMFGQFCLGK